MKESLSRPGPRLLGARILLAALLFGGVSVALAARGAGPAKLTLTWHGQACFVLQSPGGARVVMDPIPDSIGYTPPADLAADAITVSHEHADHNNVALVKGGQAKILRGLTDDKKGWTAAKAKVKDVAIRSVGVFHDATEGKERGLNAVFVFDVGGQRIAHLGDLGHLLTDKQLAEIGPVDVVLIPVGGTYTIDAAQATKVVEQLKPRTIVVPMHYKTDVLKIPLAPVDAFLAGKASVRRETGNTLELGPGKGRGKAKGKGKGKGTSGDEDGPEIVVLNYK